VGDAIPEKRGGAVYKYFFKFSFAVRF